MNLRWPLLVPTLIATACSSDPAGLLDVAVTTERTLPGLEDDAHVIRTELDVPHIYAKSVLDMHRVQGFVQAKDRYVQIELTRRFGAGRLSEVLGDLGTEIDISARSRGLRIVADRLWDNMNPELRAVFGAYAEGVNAYIAQVKAGKLPVPEELELVAGLRGISDGADIMEPMTAQDVTAAAAVIVNQLGFETDDVTTASIAGRLADVYRTGPLAALRSAGLKTDIVDSVAPVHAIAQVKPGTIGSKASGLKAERPARPTIATRPSMNLSRLVGRNQTFRNWTGKPSGDDFGSNSWAVSSAGTGGQGALLANDGHLPLTVPSLFYQMCLDADYFGDEEFSVCGLYFPGLPLMAVGTNGHVAWGQTYLSGDVTDWYEEKLRAGADGLPADSRFKGEWRPLVRVDETYTIAIKGGTDTQVWPRWTTFDGRWIIEIEGDEITGAEARDGRTGVTAIDGTYMVPRDVDGDGFINAISFDWTAFDVTTTLASVDGFSKSKTVAEMVEHTRSFVAYAQNIIFADEKGDVAYSAFHALPCREQLKDGLRWRDAGNPQRLLDGEQFGGFSVAGDACVIPFDAGPRLVKPTEGFVHTANHDPLGYGLDNDLANDEHYIGGPWGLGYRASTIDTALSADVAGAKATVASMSKLQNNHDSIVGRQYLPHIVASVNVAKSNPTDPAGQRLAAVYTANQARLDTAVARLQAWMARGGIARSGVDTFYQSPTAEEKTDAVATMIFNVWMRHFIERVLGDEPIDFIYAVRKDRKIFRTLDKIVAGRGPGNPRGLASFNPATNESAFFDDYTTAEVESSHEMIVGAFVDALDDLQRDFGTNMDGWLWGLVHQVRFDSLLTQVGAGNAAIGLLSRSFSLTTEHLPLAPQIPAGDPRERLEHFPRDGDFYAVDAAFPSMERGRFFTYGNGPVMRMVIRLDDGVIEGVNILPGGQSSRVGATHFSDQAAIWLANDTIPIRYHPESVVEGAEGRELFRP